MLRILVVDADRKAAARRAAGLARDRHVVQACHDEQAAFDLAISLAPHVVLLVLRVGTYDTLARQLRFVVPDAVLIGVGARKGDDFAFERALLDGIATHWMHHLDRHALARERGDRLRSKAPPG